MEGQFKSVSTLSKWLSRIYIALIVLLPISIIWGRIYADLINKAISGEFITEAEALTTEAIYGGIALALLVPYVLAGILFLIWVYRTHKNLPYLNVEGLRFKPGWSVGYFFIPLMALFRPYQMMVEKWKASNPNVNISNQESWKTSSSSPLIGCWWAFFLASAIAGQIVFRMGWWGGEQLSDLLAVTNATIVSDAIDIGWVITSIFIVRRISQFQEEKHRVVISNLAAA